MSIKTMLQNGVYQVTTSYFCAGFIVENGIVIDMAPILRKNIRYWITIANYVCPLK
jgi:hypothetical protein